MAAQTHEHDGCEQVIAMLRDDIDELVAQNEMLLDEVAQLSSPLGWLWRALGVPPKKEVRDVVTGLP